MAFSSGAQRDLFYVREDSFGVGPDTLDMTAVRNTEDSISLTRDSFVSDERRGDRGIHDMRLGNKQPAGDISFEFSYGAFDEFLMAALGAEAWVAPYTNLSVAVTVDAATKTFTRGDGNWLTDGVTVGDVITITELTTTANNVIAQVTEVTDTTIVFGEAVGLADITVAETGKFDTETAIIKKGKTTHSFKVEKAFTDVSEYQLYSGGVVNSMSLDISPNAMITGSFSMLFKDSENQSTAFHNNITTAPTNSPFDGFTGHIKEGGEITAETSSLSITLENGFERNFVLMDNTCPQMTSGKSNATGSVTLYFANSTVYDKFVNETESSIELKLADQDGNAYVIRLPRIKYSSADTPVSSDAAIINTMNYQALDDATEETNISITRYPAMV